MSDRIRVVKHSPTELSVQFPFSQAVVNGLKSEITVRSFRWWNKPIQSWVIEASVWDIAEGVLRKNLPHVPWIYSNEARELIASVGKYRSRATPKRAQPQLSDRKLLFVTSDAPMAVVKAAYKALALMHHPDREGGDNAKMKQLTGAFNRIKELDNEG